MYVLNVWIDIECEYKDLYAVRIEIILHKYKVRIEGKVDNVCKVQYYL